VAKVPLPKKIKTAAIILMIDGLLIPLSIILYTLMGVASEGGIYGHSNEWGGILFTVFFAAILLIPTAILIFLKIKWAWFAAISILCLILICIGLFVFFDLSEYKNCINNTTIYSSEPLSVQQANDMCRYFYPPQESWMAFELVNTLGISIFYVFLHGKESLLKVISNIFFILTLAAFIFLPLTLLILDKKKYWESASSKLESNNLNGQPVIQKNEILPIQNKDKLNYLLSWKLGIISIVLVLFGEILLKIINIGEIEQVIGNLYYIVPVNKITLFYFFAVGGFALYGINKGVKEARFQNKKRAIFGIILCILAFAFSISLGFNMYSQKDFLMNCISFDIERLNFCFQVLYPF
jgi:hypothetical protein